MSALDLDFEISLLTVNAEPASLVPFVVHASGVRRRASSEEVALWNALQETRRQLAGAQGAAPPAAQARPTRPGRR